MKERIRKTSQTMQLNKPNDENQTGKREIKKNTNKIKEVKIVKK